VIYDGEFMLKLAEVLVPSAWTEPVPIHPVHLYLVPAPSSSAGLVTVAETDASKSYQLVSEGLGEPCAELTTKRY